MTDCNFDFSEYDPRRVRLGGIQQKMSKGKVTEENPEGKQIAYYVSDISYTYDVPNKEGGTTEVVTDFKIELPWCFSPTGVLVAQGNYGEQATMMVKFSQADPQCMAFAKVTEGGDDEERGGPFDDLYWRAYNHIWDNRDRAQNIKVNKKAGLEGMFKHPIYWARDAKNNLDKKDPSKWFNLIYWGKEGSPLARRTLFHYPEEDENGDFEQIPFQDMIGYTCEFKPLVHIRRIYMGNTISMQMDLVSAAVRKRTKIGSASTQKKTLKAEAQNAETRESIKREVAELRALKKIREEEKANGGNKLIESSSKTVGKNVGKSKGNNSLGDFISGAPKLAQKQLPPPKSRKQLKDSDSEDGGSPPASPAKEKKSKKKNKKAKSDEDEDLEEKDE
jgi:hypothetical protein